MSCQRCCVSIYIYIYMYMYIHPYIPACGQLKGDLTLCAHNVNCPYLRSKLPVYHPKPDLMIINAHNDGIHPNVGARITVNIFIYVYVDVYVYVYESFGCHMQSLISTISHILGQCSLNTCTTTLNNDQTICRMYDLNITHGCLLTCVYYMRTLCTLCRSRQRPLIHRQSCVDIASK